MLAAEVLLAELPGAADDDRALLVLVPGPAGETRLELRQQSWGEGVGWFTQSTVRLTTDQAADLRLALGAGPAARVRRPRSLSADRRLRLLTADSA